MFCDVHWLMKHISYVLFLVMHIFTVLYGITLLVKCIICKKLGIVIAIRTYWQYYVVKCLETYPYATCVAMPIFNIIVLIIRLHGMIYIRGPA
jgi:hypothetical protein